MKRVCGHFRRKGLRIVGSLTAVSRGIIEETWSKHSLQKQCCARDILDRHKRYTHPLANKAYITPLVLPLLWLAVVRCSFGIFKPP